MIEGVAFCTYLLFCYLLFVSGFVILILVYLWYTV